MRSAFSFSFPQTVSVTIRRRVVPIAALLTVMLVVMAVSAAADIESARKRWNSLVAQEAEVLAPKRYRDAHKGMRGLEKAIDANDVEEQQKKLEKVEEELEALNEAGSDRQGGLARVAGDAGSGARGGCCYRCSQQLETSGIVVHLSCREAGVQSP